MTTTFDVWTRLLSNNDDDKIIDILVELIRSLSQSLVRDSNETEINYF